MPLLTHLPSTLLAAGQDVYVLPGFETRSTRASGLGVLGIVVHHTATSTSWQDGHVAALLRDGRRDLDGPLSQLGLERDATFVAIAAGRANHNGYGLWGNDSIGIEVYNNGTGEPYPDVQYRALVVGVAALLQHHNLPVSKVMAHKETNPTRKIDPLFDMDQFRRDVATQGDDDMPLSEPEWLRLEQIVQKAVQSLLETDPKTDAALKAKRFSLNQIASEVVARLPPSSGGGVTQAQVQAACEVAIDKHLGFLKPGQ